MSEAKIALDIVIGLIKAVPAIGEVLSSLTGETPEQLLERLERARREIKDPISTTADDAARRAELDRVLRGT